MLHSVDVQSFEGVTRELVLDSLKTSNLNAAWDLSVGDLSHLFIQMSRDAVACFNDGCKVVVRNMVAAVKLCGRLDRQGTVTADERGSCHVAKIEAKLGTAR